MDSFTHNKPQLQLKKRRAIIKVGHSLYIFFICFCFLKEATSTYPCITTKLMPHKPVLVGDGSEGGQKTLTLAKREGLEKEIGFASQAAVNTHDCAVRNLVFMLHILCCLASIIRDVSSILTV